MLFREVRGSDEGTPGRPSVVRPFNEKINPLSRLSENRVRFFPQTFPLQNWNTPCLPPIHGLSPPFSLLAKIDEKHVCLSRPSAFPLTPAVAPLGEERPEKKKRFWSRRWARFPPGPRRENRAPLFLQTQQPRVLSLFP